MSGVTLKAALRTATGKGAARKLRAEGKVPATLYGGGAEATSIVVDRREFLTALNTDAGMNVLLNIQVDGSTELALTRELQRDPVRGTLLHADFVKVDRRQEIEVEVPVHLVGEAPGVKEGGALEHPLFTVHVRCLPTDVPEAVDADVSGLGIGDSLRVSDLGRERTFAILNDPDEVVATVSAPISDEQLAALEAGAGQPAGEVGDDAAEPVEATEEGAAAAEEPAADT